MTTLVPHYQQQGPADASPVILAPSLGTTMAMWDELAAELTPEYRVVRFDTRGHGGSPVPMGPYSPDELADDVLALADTLGIERFTLIGLSLGGATAQTLALRHPNRLTGMVLCCTSPAFGSPADWHDRAARVRAEGMGWLLEPTGHRWFPAAFREANPRRVAGLLDEFARTPAEGYAACCEALAGFDVRPRLGEISTPTTVIAGTEDPVSPPAVARELRSAIPGAELVEIDNAAHIANVAQPRAFNTAVEQHLEKHL